MPTHAPIDGSVGGSGSGGGGFTPTPWAIEYYEVFLSTDANDANFVQLAGPITYDPKKEYFMAIAGDFSTSLVKPAGAPTLLSLMPHSFPESGFAPDGFGQVSDPNQPFNIKFANDFGSWALAATSLINQGAFGIPDATYPPPDAVVTGDIGPIALDVFGSSQLGLSINDGTFYRFFNSNGNPYDTAWLIASRQLIA